MQEAFIETGVIQSGYKHPAQILCAYAPLQQNSNPTEAEVREASPGVLDLGRNGLRQAGRKGICGGGGGAAREDVPPYGLERAIPAPPELFGSPFDDLWFGGGDGSGDVQTRTKAAIIVCAAGSRKRSRPSARANPKSTRPAGGGKPALTDDIELPGMLHAA
ncbi:MAG: hypothetical protein IPK17_05180, partial [Chloroflexi bacterium]|nr:hypothetical protein [Chloroflexota bacterium]